MEPCTRPVGSSSRRVALVVDDDSRVRESLSSLLSAAGIETNLFDSGTDLIRSTALSRAGCLITDVRMPGMDGWELQRQVSLLYPRLPIIFISAYQDEPTFRYACSLGVFAFLYKPFDGEELLCTVEAALARTLDSESPHG